MVHVFAEGLIDYCNVALDKLQIELNLHLSTLPSATELWKLIKYMIEIYTERYCVLTMQKKCQKGTYGAGKNH